MTSVTIDGTRYVLDADGRVLGPDADGREGQLLLGTVRRSTVNPRWWVSDPGAEHGIRHEHHTRTDGVRCLAGLDWGVPF